LTFKPKVNPSKPKKKPSLGPKLDKD